MRLNAFLEADYATLLAHWERDRARVLARGRKPRPDTKERRLHQCMKLFYQGFVSRGLRRLEGNGITSADDPKVRQQMLDKHPQVPETWTPPIRRDDSDDPTLDSLRKATIAVDPKVGVGPRGFRSYYARALAVGKFTDPEAKTAFESFRRLGIRYLNGTMPPWLRRQLGSGLLTPLAKEPPVTGETPDSRPTKAEDIDTALWCKALQLDSTPKPRPGEPVEGIRKHLEPQ